MKGILFFLLSNFEGMASSQYIWGAMPEDLLRCCYARIASLPLEGKVPRRGG